MNKLPPQKLINEIFQATEQMQMEFPTHYRYLSETPLFMFDKQKGLCSEDFEQYLASLLGQLETQRLAEKNYD
jgi:hypothetical protein